MTAITVRRRAASPRSERLHQEDFCQAQGIVSEHKYQKEGGAFLLKQCFALLRDVSSAPVMDLALLLDAVIFNYLVGNNDDCPRQEFLSALPGDWYKKTGDPGSLPL